MMNKRPLLISLLVLVGAACGPPRAASTTPPTADPCSGAIDGGWRLRAQRPRGCVRPARRGDRLRARDRRRHGGRALPSAVDVQDRQRDDRARERRDLWRASHVALGRNAARTSGLGARPRPRRSAAW